MIAAVIAPAGAGGDPSGFIDFARHPIGRQVTGRTYICWCPGPTMCITVVWGVPRIADARELTRLCEVAFHPAMEAPFLTLIDVRRLDAVDPEAFAHFTRYVIERGSALGKIVKRQALVRPGGLIGAITSGFFPVFGSPYDARVFTAAEPALEWLGASASVARSLEARVEAARRTPETLHALRALLAKGETRIGPAARALGVSQRTLQRQLAEAGTSFRAEVLTTRVDRARQLLADTEKSVTAIAFEAGFSSLQHCASAFRALVGHSPSRWRSLARSRHPMARR